MAPAWSPAPDGLPFDLRATLVPDGQQHFIATFIRILSYIVKSNLENLCAFDAQAHANIFNRKGSTLVATMADFDGAARPEWMGLGVQRPTGVRLRPAKITVRRLNLTATSKPLSRSGLSLGWWTALPGLIEQIA